MKTILVGLVFFCLSVGINAHAENMLDTASTKYGEFKQQLHDKHGLDYTLRGTFTGYHAAPDGGDIIMRSKYEVEANWDMFSSKFGNGSIQFLWEDIEYADDEAADVAKNIHIASPFSEDARNRHFLKRLSYTHQLPGALDKVSITAGQYLIGVFGKTNSKSRPYSYFSNYTFMKNMTKSYPTGGLGGYITYKPTKHLTLISGLQDSTNFFPRSISTDDIGDGKWTGFLYAQYTPQITSLGKTVLTGWIYHSPRIKKYDGKYNKAYPYDANGYVLNLRQDLNQWSLMLKLNGASGKRNAIDQSVALDVLYNNPFGRNPLDQIGVGVAYNEIANKNKQYVRGRETFIEMYYNFGISSFFTIRPDVQIYFHPAQTTHHNTAFVTSIQAKVLF